MVGSLKTMAGKGPSHEKCTFSRMHSYTSYTYALTLLGQSCTSRNIKWSLGWYPAVLKFWIISSSPSIFIMHYTFFLYTLGFFVSKIKSRGLVGLWNWTIETVFVVDCIVEILCSNLTFLVCGLIWNKLRPHLKVYQCGCWFTMALNLCPLYLKTLQWKK